MPLLEDPSLIVLAGLFLLALVAGTIDAMAGGGGLLTVPGLLAAGIDPISALATNKVQGIFSPLSATVHFWREGKIKLQENFWPAAAAFFGAALGAVSLSYADPGVLRRLVPYLLILIALWMLLSPQMGRVQRKSRISAAVFSLSIIPLIAFYDGFFGPGTGTFFALSLVGLLGLSLQEATVRTKVLNFSTNLGALSVFLFSGHILWRYGLVMAVGMMIGGNIGARLVLRHGTTLIKPMLVATSLAMSAKLLLTD